MSKRKYKWQARGRLTLFMKLKPHKSRESLQKNLHGHLWTKDVHIETRFTKLTRDDEKTKQVTCEWQHLLIEIFLDLKWRTSHILNGLEVETQRNTSLIFKASCHYFFNNGILTNSIKLAAHLQQKTTTFQLSLLHFSCLSFGQLESSQTWPLSVTW